MKIQNFLGIVIIVILFASLALFYYVIEIYTSATADYKLQLIPNGKVWIIDGSTDKIIKTTTLDSVPYYIEQDNL
jgi:hypothetical protein